MPEEVVMDLDCGACRFRAHITVVMEDGDLIYTIESECPHVKRLAQKFKRAPMMACMKMPFAENEIYRVCGEELKHSACPVPMALIKGSEVAAGLGVKREVKLEFKRN